MRSECWTYSINVLPKLHPECVPVFLPKVWPNCTESYTNDIKVNPTQKDMEFLQC